MLLVVDEGDIRTVQWLFEHGAQADVRRANNRGMTPMFYACCDQDFELLEWLFDHGAQADVRRATNQGCTPMCAACNKDSLEMVLWLFNHGAQDDVRQATIEGCTPMMIVSKNNNVKLAQWLFDHGAQDDVRTPDNDGLTPLAMACDWSRFEMVEWLIDHGAQDDVAISADNNCTPMWMACRDGDMRIIQLLHKHAAQEINKKTGRQSTPLQALCMNSHCHENSLEVIQWLILQGTPSKLTIASWFNKLENQMRTDLYKQGVKNRDGEHENYLHFVCNVKHSTTLNAFHVLDIDLVLDKIGDFIRGRQETRSLWYHIVQQGPAVDE